MPPPRKHSVPMLEDDDSPKISLINKASEPTKSRITPVKTKLKRNNQSMVVKSALGPKPMDKAKSVKFLTKESSMKPKAIQRGKPEAMPESTPKSVKELVRGTPKSIVN